MTTKPPLQKILKGIFHTQKMKTNKTTKDGKYYTYEKNRHVLRQQQ
jgi:hypothetical protein